MAFTYITEYEALARDRFNYHIAAGAEPAIAEQRVDNTGASTQSAAFNERTAFIMVHTDGICSIKIGANPTALVTGHRMAAGETRFYGVQPGHKIAVIANT
jgi:hypothetical protein